MEILREWTARMSHRLFALTSDSWLIRLAVWTCAAMVVGIPLKIWNAIRIEQSLEEQKRLLLEARLDALQRRSIRTSSLTPQFHRFARPLPPEQARELIVKLANILRKMLNEHDAFVPFRDELGTTDDYLSIEIAVLAQKSSPSQEIDPQTWNPGSQHAVAALVENSIKHGLEPRSPAAPSPCAAAWSTANSLSKLKTMASHAPGRAHTSGVPSGHRHRMRNVRERLEVLYGGAALFEVMSGPAAEPG